MKKVIKTQFDLEAPLQYVWKLIKTGERWEDWFSILSGSKVEGRKRTCELYNGDCLDEIFTVSDAEKTFIYHVNQQQTFPAEDIVGIIRLQEKGKKTRMYWSVEMTVSSDEVFSELKPQIEQMYAEAANTLNELAMPTV
ncbi:MAG: SRPBCC family protein [Bacteroidota bacterium]